MLVGVVAAVLAAVGWCVWRKRKPARVGCQEDGKTPFFMLYSTVTVLHTCTVCSAVTVHLYVVQSLYSRTWIASSLKEGQIGTHYQRYILAIQGAFNGTLLHEVGAEQ